MSNQPNSTRAQKLFLQAFRDNPAGPPPSQWPAPSTLQRWLRHEHFRKILTQYRDAMHFQADFHIAAAATTAAKSIHSTVTAPAPSIDPSTAADSPDLTKQLKSLTDLLRLSHIRQRFTSHPEPTATDDENSTKAKCHHVPRAGIQWTDQPHIIANIFCDQDKGRLKAYMLLLTTRGYKGFEPFLASFPEELARAKAAAEQRNKPSNNSSNNQPA